MENIQHVSDESRFVIQCDDQGNEAELRYRLSQGSSNVTTINFISTFVPAEYRSKGFAEKLVRAGVRWAREQGYEMHASCWYAAKFIRK